MQPPAVSVVMPVYNTERFVAQAVESILAQTFTDFELVIIDDGSTDRSLEILQRYAAQDKRIRLTSRPNRGIARTRNELLAQARGEFMALMDSDDIALADRLDRQVAFLQQHPQVVCLGSAYQFIDEKDRLLLTCREPEDNAEIQKGLLAGYANRMLNPSLMIRRAALVEVGGYDETTLAEDLEVCLRLGEIGELANLAEPLMKYRIRMTSFCGEKHSLYTDDARKACSQAWQRRGIAGSFDAGTEGPMRPQNDRRSQHPFLIKYGWWAFSSGQRQTALDYALQAIRSLPWAADGWKLLTCAAIKPLPTSNQTP